MSSPGTQRKVESEARVAQSEMSIICGNGGSHAAIPKADRRRLFALGFVQLSPLIFAICLDSFIPDPNAVAVIFAAGIAGSIFVAGKLRHYAPLTPLDG